MRAAVFHGPEDIRIEDLPEPDLADGGLVIQTAATGLCGSDLRTYHFGHPKITGPQILGHEVAGIVVRSGTGAYPVGSRVAVAPGTPCLECSFCRRGKQNMCGDRPILGREVPGGLAERFPVSAQAVRAGTVIEVPDGVDLTHAPVAEPLNAVLNGQDRARTGPYDRVLVLGLGPIGVLHLAVARARGAAATVGVDPRPGRVDAAADVLGADALFTMTEGWERRVLEHSGGDGFDVIVLANTAPQAFGSAMDLVAVHGRILAFAGLPKTTPTVPADLNDIHYRETEIIGAFGATPGHFRSAVQWLGDGHMDLDRFVTERITLEEINAGFEGIAKGVGMKTMVVF